jgi:hypothetical protein
VDKVAIAHVNSGVTNLAALFVPEVKAITGDEVFEPHDLLPNEGLFSGGTW